MHARGPVQGSNGICRQLQCQEGIGPCFETAQDPATELCDIFHHQAAQAGIGRAMHWAPTRVRASTAVLAFLIEHERPNATAAALRSANSDTCSPALDTISFPGFLPPLPRPLALWFSVARLALCVVAGALARSGSALPVVPLSGPPGRCGAARDPQPSGRPGLKSRVLYYKSD